MEYYPPTEDELHNGFSSEKLQYLEKYAIRDFQKLIIGKKYALLSNGYYLGRYDNSKFISHLKQGWMCGCHELIFLFTRPDSTDKDVQECRGLYCIETIGVIEIID